MSAPACLWEIGKVTRAPERRTRTSEYGRGMSGRADRDMVTERKKRERREGEPQVMPVSGYSLDLGHLKKQSSVSVLTRGHFLPVSWNAAEKNMMDFNHEACWH